MQLTTASHNYLYLYRNLTEIVKDRPNRLLTKIKDTLVSVVFFMCKHSKIGIIQDLSKSVQSSDFF